MKIRSMVAMATVAFVVGCGGGTSDPNKDLKPIDPSSTAPKMATEGAGAGGKAPGDKPATVIK